MHLKLNAVNTKLIWFDRRSRPDDDKQIKNLNLDSSCYIPPSDVIRGLWLNMTQHISSTARTCFFHRRRILLVSETLP